MFRHLKIFFLSNEERIFILKFKIQTTSLFIHKMVD